MRIEQTERDAFRTRPLPEAPSFEQTAPARPATIAARRESAPVLLAQLRPDEVLSADGRMSQPLALSDVTGRAVGDFLGVDLVRDANGRSTPAYLSFQPMPAGLMRPGLFGGAGINRDGNAFALVDTGQVGDKAVEFGVASDHAIATITAQEVLHAATMSHPSMRGRFTTEQTELLGEAFSLRFGGEDYLPFHLNLVANSVRTALQPGSEGYTVFDAISSPVIGRVLADHAVDLEGTDDASAFFGLFANYAASRQTQILLGNLDPRENIVVAFARDELGVNKPDLFAWDLILALGDAYGTCASALLADRDVPHDGASCSSSPSGRGIFQYF